LPAHSTQDEPSLPQSAFVVPGWQMSWSSQHPLGHVVKLHVAPVHTPLTHASPATHAAHAVPPVPQSFSVSPVWQFPDASQQPVGHVVALHAEASQVPAGHVSLAGHAVHALPPVPQNVVVVPVSQTPEPLQQPVGHEAGPQVGAWQAPPLHVSVAGHTVHAFPPVPHPVVLVPDSQKPRASQQPMGHVEGPHVMPLQTPAEQESPGGHGTHALPPVPQAVVLVPVSQFPRLSQHPVGQLAGLQVTPSQAPAVQLSPGGQASQAFPPLPHAVVLVPVSHTPEPLQQPVGQVEPLQGGGSQVPPVQLSPDGQTMQASPPRPHPVVLVPDSQKPRGSQQPVGHVIGLHAGPLHAPPEHESPGGQGRHAFPPVPHAVVLLPDSQLPALLQHPSGQLVELHVVP
jgi:hypothetical protein